MKLTKKDFKKPKEVKREGKRIDPVQELKRAYAKPTRVAKVGGRGYV